MRAAHKNFHEDFSSNGLHSTRLLLLLLACACPNVSAGIRATSRRRTFGWRRTMRNVRANGERVQAPGTLDRGPLATRLAGRSLFWVLWQEWCVVGT